MRVGIVGSRERQDRETVERIVAELPAGTVVVSGGARGVDAFAAGAARARGLEVVEHLPDLAGVRSRGESASRYYARNARIAQDCDRLVALVAPDRKGGTENTIKAALALGRPVQIVEAVDDPTRPQA